MKKKKIVIIGGGPAGMIASIAASRFGHTVTLVEKNHTLGKKLLLTGNGRCNFTNTANIELFLSKFGRSGRFLRDSYNALSVQSLIRFFENRGLRCKIEEDGRVFPLSDNAADLLDILKKEITLSGVNLIKSAVCRDLSVNNGKIDAVILSGNKTISCNEVILSTGGVSYSATGSSGDGFDLTRRLGHSIVPLRPGLVPVIVKEDYPKLLAGLSLSDISIKIFSGSRAVKTEKGDVLFTHKGLSGPLILSNSGVISKLLYDKKEVFISLDIFPKNSREEIDTLLSEYIKTEPGKNIKNCLKDLVPKRLLELFLSLALTETNKRSNQVTRKERTQLVSLCKDFRLTVTNTSPIEEAMVTIGGISLKEIDPKTMSSRIISGLYFAGEILDITGDTGGFNLHAAFSTGHLAGLSASNKNS